MFESQIMITRLELIDINVVELWGIAQIAGKWVRVHFPQVNMIIRNLYINANDGELMGGCYIERESCYLNGIETFFEIQELDAEEIKRIKREAELLYQEEKRK